jgi:hypothetical protein
MRLGSRFYNNTFCHCEERSDEATANNARRLCLVRGCRAALAMT